MREIKFRGKSKDNGEWVYGDLRTEITGEPLSIFTYDHTTSIIEVEVIPETVGQYTGLKDWKDKEIYEGDVIDNERGGYAGVIEFVSGAFLHRGDPLGFYVEEKEIQGESLEMLNPSTWAIIIGNIHDNPELLK